MDGLLTSSAFDEGASRGDVAELVEVQVANLFGCVSVHPSLLIKPFIYLVIG